MSAVLPVSATIIPLKSNNKGHGMTDYTQVPNKLITLKIPPAEKAILLVIARFTYGYQRIQCEMSLAQIAEYTDLSRRTVYKLVADLEKKGFLSVVRGKADGINTLNSYQLIDLYSGENISLGREEISLGVGKNLHGGRENISPSKESIKEKDNIPPIVPPQGEASTPSLASEIIDTQDEVVQPAKPRAKKASPVLAQPKTLEEVDIANLETPLPLQKGWMQDPRIKQAFTDVMTDYELQATPTLWKFVAGGFVDYWTGLDPRAKKARKVDWVATFRNWTRKAANDNQWRWKKDGAALTSSDSSKLIVPEDISDGGTQLQKWAVAHGFRKAQGTETGWNYLQAVKAWAAEKNGGAV